MSPYGGSALFYAQERRRRARSYQAFLAGDAEDTSAIVGAGTGAFGDPNSPWRSIMIGVATGAITYLVTKMLESAFPRRSR